MDYEITVLKVQNRLKNREMIRKEQDTMGKNRNI